MNLWMNLWVWDEQDCRDEFLNFYKFEPLNCIPLCALTVVQITNKMFFVQESEFKSQIFVLKLLELVIFMFWVTWVFNRVEPTHMKVEDDVKNKEKFRRKKRKNKSEKINYYDIITFVFQYLLDIPLNILFSQKVNVSISIAAIRSLLNIDC